MRLRPTMIPAERIARDCSRYTLADFERPLTTHATSRSLSVTSMTPATSQMPSLARNLWLLVCGM